MATVTLLSPQNTERTVSDTITFNQLVYAQGFRPVSGSIAANMAALMGSSVVPPVDLGVADPFPQYVTLAELTAALAGLGGGTSAPDATGTVKGLLRLAGALGGTAASPTAFGLASADALTEAIQDTVAAMVVAGSGLSKTYDDAANLLILTATGSGGGTPGAVSAVDNGDGTATVTGSGVTDNGDGSWTASGSNVVDNGDGTFVITS